MSLSFGARVTASELPTLLHIHQQHHQILHHYFRILHLLAHHKICMFCIQRLPYLQLNIINDFHLQHLVSIWIIMTSLKLSNKQVDSEYNKVNLEFDIGHPRRHLLWQHAYHDTSLTHTHKISPPQRKTNPVFSLDHNQSDGPRHSQASISPSALSFFLLR